MDKINTTIAETLLFRGLPEEHLKKIAQTAVKKRYEKGEAVFTEGEAADGFYVVEKGSIKIFKVSMEGKEHILHIFGPGEPFGEVPVFSGGNFPASAEAITQSRLFFFPRSDFVNLISSNPSLALNMLALLSTRLRQFTVQIENLSLKEVPGRLAAYLVYLSQKLAGEHTVTLDISKGQLASLLGTIPETLSRIFSKMNALNLIEVNDREIRLLDMDGLKDLAESGKI